MKRRTGIRRATVVCPECGHEFRIQWNSDIRRFQAKQYRCPECEFVGRRGAFDRPGWRAVGDENAE